MVRAAVLCRPTLLRQTLKLKSQSVILLALNLMTPRSIAKLRPIKQRANLFAGD